MPYADDVLADFNPNRRKTYPKVTPTLGDVVEDRASRFCGDVVKMTSEAVTLRSPTNEFRHFAWKDGGFLVEGRPVTLVRPAPAAAAPKLTSSGSVAAAVRRAKTAKASRIWVEGKHDAELIEHVWGDDLRDIGIVVEPMHGADDLVAAVEEFQPGPQRRLGVLLDHLVDGSKESRLAAQVRDEHVLIVGHPFVDVWAAVRPKVMGLERWPDVPRGQPWKEGMCRALGTDLDRFWPQLRNRVQTFADLQSELVGAVEQLIDFVDQG